MVKLVHASRHHWSRRARSAVAALAVAVQMVLLLAPLGELREARAIAADFVTDAAAPGGQLVTPAHQPTRAHNEATCPACIARSMQARLESRAPLPVLVVAERAPAEPVSTRPPHAELYASHLSRAPPVAG